jgi:hypothetical protein
MNRRETIEQEIENINQEIQLVLHKYPNEAYKSWCLVKGYNPRIYVSRARYVTTLKEKIKQLKANLSQP